MLLDEQVAEGVRPPTGYGLAYHDPLYRVGHFYPLPLNWLVQWARSFWFWLVRGPGPNALDQANMRACQVERRVLQWRVHVEALPQDALRDQVLEHLDTILGEEVL